MADKKAVAKDEVAPADTQAVPLQPAQAPAPPATVKEAGGWHLVSYGSWQISVAPDGLLMLPRHLHPEDFAHFVACGKVAADIGSKIQAGNTAKENLAAAATSRARTPLPTRQAILTQGPAPQGTKRMRVASGQQRSATIGRRNRETPVAEHNPTRHRADG